MTLFRLLLSAHTNLWQDNYKRNRKVYIESVLQRISAKTPLRPWQTRTHCCGHIVAHYVSLARKRHTLCFHAAQTGKHLLRTQNVSEQNQEHVLCPGHKICVRKKCCARGQTGNICVGNNMSSFGRAFRAFIYICLFLFASKLLIGCLAKRAAALTAKQNQSFKKLCFGAAISSLRILLQRNIMYQNKYKVGSDVFRMRVRDVFSKRLINISPIVQDSLANGTSISFPFLIFPRRMKKKQGYLCL